MRKLSGRLILKLCKLTTQLLQIIQVDTSRQFRMPFQTAELNYRSIKLGFQRLDRQKLFELPRMLWHQTPHTFELIRIHSARRLNLELFLSQLDTLSSKSDLDWRRRQYCRSFLLQLAYSWAVFWWSHHSHSKLFGSRCCLLLSGSHLHIAAKSEAYFRVRSEEMLRTRAAHLDKAPFGLRHKCKRQRRTCGSISRLPQTGLKVNASHVWFLLMSLNFGRFGFPAKLRCCHSEISAKVNCNQLN